MANLLTISRAMGLENVAQLRGLVKGVRNAGLGTAHIKLDSGSADTFQKMLTEMAPEAAQSVTISRLAFPEVYAQGAKNFIDIIAKRFGNGSGKITLSSVLKNGKNVVAKSDVRVLGNKAGYRIIGNSNVGEKASTAIDATLCRFGKTDLTSARTAALNGINYTENAGVSRLTADVKKAGIVRDLKADIKVPTDYLDGIVRPLSGKSFGENIADFKKAIG